MTHLAIVLALTAGCAIGSGRREILTYFRGLAVVFIEYHRERLHMSTPSTPSFWTALATILKHDAVLTVAPPLQTFLGEVQAAKGDPIKLAAGVASLQGAFAVALPQLAGAVEADVAAAVSGLLTSATASASATSAS